MNVVVNHSHLATIVQRQEHCVPWKKEEEEEERKREGGRRKEKRREGEEREGEERGKSRGTKMQGFYAGEIPQQNEFSASSHNNEF